MEEKVFCSECGKELIKRLNPITNTEMISACSCTIEKAEREKQEILQKGLEKIRKEIFSENGVCKKFSRTTLNQINAVKGQEKAYKAAGDFLERFSGDKSAKGFGLFGGVGSGKTYISTAVVNQLCNERIERSSEYEKEQAFFGRITVLQPAFFISCIGLLESLKIDSALIKKYKTVNLLIIDDLGAARITEWADERLFEIIDFRYSEELPIIFTTNVTPAELKEKMDKRTIDRLNEMCDFISVTASSQRK